MSLTIDNIELDEENLEFNNASELVKHTNRLIYLTGKAGTGKTTFLKFLKHNTNKNTIILAPTGVAAINAGGQTIHSFFQIKPSVYALNDNRLRINATANDLDKSTIYDHFRYQKEKLEIIKGMQLLIIDEVSMVRCDLLDVIDRLLRVFRKRIFEVFGGVQVILIGDTFQLPPIAETEQWGILRQFYDSPFFFSSDVIKKNKPIYIELKKIYRQTEQDFIELLNRVRINQVSQNDLLALNNRLNPSFSPKGNNNYITLATHNKIVDTTNSERLTELTAELKTFEAVISGAFPDNIFPTNRILELKEGAQIMFIKNDRQKRYYNGKIAKIKSIVENEIIVEFSENDEIIVEKETWNNIKYSWNNDSKVIEEEIVGVFSQFPIKLAWAITVHKSQGLTFEKVIADLGAAFSSGQVYVALSRCTSFNGIVLKTRIERSAIKTDLQVLKFAQNETPNTLIIEELNSGRADFYYKIAREAIKENNYSFAIDNFIKAVKYRNDIETEIFKRYITLTLERLKSNNSWHLQVIEKLNDLEDKAIENNGLLNKIERYKKEINSQKLVINFSKERLKDLETQNIVANQQLIKYKKEFQKESSVLVHKGRVLEKIIVEQKKEISRLRSLTWYEKLLGYK